LIVLFSLAEATLPAQALSIRALTLDVRSTDAAGAFILVRKGKGHGDGTKASSGTAAIIPRERRGIAASTAIKGVAIS
jgi:hypothetical protein